MFTDVFCTGVFMLSSSVMLPELCVNDTFLKLGV